MTGILPPPARNIKILKSTEILPPPTRNSQKILPPPVNGITNNSQWNNTGPNSRSHSSQSQWSNDTWTPSIQQTSRNYSPGNTINNYENNSPFHWETSYDTINNWSQNSYSSGNNNPNERSKVDLNHSYVNKENFNHSYVNHNNPFDNPLDVNNANCEEESWNKSGNFDNKRRREYEKTHKPFKKIKIYHTFCNPSVVTKSVTKTKILPPPPKNIKAIKKTSFLKDEEEHSETIENSEPSSLQNPILMMKSENIQNDQHVKYRAESACKKSFLHVDSDGQHDMVKNNQHDVIDKNVIDFDILNDENDDDYFVNEDDLFDKEDDLFGKSKQILRYESLDKCLKQKKIPKFKLLPKKSLNQEEEKDIIRLNPENDDNKIKPQKEVETDYIKKEICVLMSSAAERGLLPPPQKRFRNR